MQVNELAVESIFIDDREFYNENSRDSHNLWKTNKKYMYDYEYSIAKRSNPISNANCIQHMQSVMECYSDILAGMKF